jgi:hypothetical protein
MPDVELQVLDTELQVATTSAGACSQSRRQNAVDPATSQQRGSITWDREHGFDLEWDSPEDFHKWCKSEQRAHGVELRISHTRRPQGSTKSAVFSGFSFLSVHAKELGALKNTRGKLNTKVTRTARGLRAAVPAVF